MKEVIVMHEIFEDCRLIKVCNCREKMERERAETIERNFNSHQTMDLLYPQNKQCMTLFCLLLKIIGFGYSSNQL